jgi:hypothetical protein
MINVKIQSNWNYLIEFNPSSDNQKKGLNAYNNRPYSATHHKDLNK